MALGELYLGLRQSEEDDSGVYHTVLVSEVNELKCLKFGQSL